MSTVANKRISLTLITSLALLCASSLLSQSSSSPDTPDVSPDASYENTRNPRPAPVAYEALYEARAMGMRSTAYRRLELLADGEYSLRHGLSASVLGANLITVEESSRFRWDDAGAVPLVYQYQQSGVRRRNEQVSFDYEQGSAQMSRENREQSLPLNGRILDDLSFSAQMSADLLADSSLHTPETILSYQIIDARRLQTHQYRVLGAEIISTGAGELDTLKLERIRDADSDRTTTLWLAPANQFTLAKLSQVENGSNMELTLQQISWTD